MKRSMRPSQIVAVAVSLWAASSAGAAPALCDKAQIRLVN
jgi:hypothetical protein